MVDFVGVGVAVCRACLGWDYCFVGLGLVIVDVGFGTLSFWLCRGGYLVVTAIVRCCFGFGVVLGLGWLGGVVALYDFWWVYLVWLDLADCLRLVFDLVFSWLWAWCNYLCCLLVLWFIIAMVCVVLFVWVICCFIV